MKIKILSLTTVTLSICATSLLGQDFVWAPTSAPNTNWTCIASSSDGTRLAAAADNSGSGGIYTSSDSGVSWAQTGAPFTYWGSIASSSDGTKLVAAADGGFIYTSANSGQTWAQTTAPNAYWTAISSSFDGTKLAAAFANAGGTGTSGAIYTSTDSGQTWTQTSAPMLYWFSIAASSDGTKLAAVVGGNGGGIYASTNSGLTWTKTSAPNLSWFSIASSSDGTKLAAAVRSSGIYTSTNSGLTWTETIAPNQNWQSIVSSSDGNYLAAAVFDGGIYASADSGQTWMQTTAPDLGWYSIASSSDGTKLAAGVFGGNIYTGIQPLDLVITLADPTNGGVATGGGTFNVGSSVQISATANTGWTFTGWNDGSTQNPRRVTVPSNDVAYVANFATNTGIVSLIAMPTDGGTVSGGGTFGVGSQERISASPNTGWTFTGWNDGNTQNPRTITVLSGVSAYAASFTFVTNTAVVNLIASPSSGGAVIGGGTFEIGSEVQISATANTDWIFSQWNDGNTSNPRSITVPAGGAVYVANFQQQASVSVVASPLNGGAVAGGGLYNVGSQVQISENPANGWTFTGWNDGSTENPRTVAVPLGGTTFTAGFAFTGLAARYVGLFSDSNGITPQSSGAINATLTATRKFSASLALQGKTYSFSGQFSPVGSTSNRIARTGETPLVVQLSLDSFIGDVLNGEISGGAWTAEIVAERTAFSTTNHAPQSGKYTLVIPAGSNDTDAPDGDGYGAITVSTLGSVTASGALGDGTAFSQNATLSEQGTWPLFVALYSGSGEIFGWLAFSNTPTSDITGPLTWIKPRQPASKLYPAGFTNQLQTVGSRFGFTNGHPILNLANGYISLSGGNLAEGITNSVAVTSSGKVTGTNHLSLTVNTTSGLFTGSIVNPTTKKTINVSGTVLEKQNIGVGYFLGTNESGEVLLGLSP